MAAKTPAQRRTARGTNSKPDKLMRDAIIVALHRAGDDGKTKRLYKIADKLVDKAVAGDIMAIKEINDRVDGRAPQYMEMAGKDGQSLVQPVINVTISEPESAPAPKAGNGADHPSN